MKLVEIVPGIETSAATIEAATGLASSVGKTPIRVNDCPGFVSNRVLMPMINEAVFCVMEGVGDAAAVDGVMKLGMNHPMGPLELADLIWFGRLFGYNAGALRGLWGLEVPPLPAARENGRGGPPGAEDRKRLLRLSPGEVKSMAICGRPKSPETGNTPP